MASKTLNQITDELFELCDLKLNQIKKLEPHATYFNYVKTEYEEILQTILKITTQQNSYTLDILKKIKSFFLYEIQDAKKIFYIVLTIKRLINKQVFYLKHSNEVFIELETKAYEYNANSSKENAKELIKKYQEFIDKEFYINTVGLLALQIRNNANKIKEKLEALVDPKTIQQKYQEFLELNKKFKKDDSMKKTIDKSKKNVQSLRDANRAVAIEMDILTTDERKDSKELKNKIERFLGIEVKDQTIHTAYMQTIQIIVKKKADIMKRKR